jgi:predicted Rdx family selenoprotein
VQVCAANESPISPLCQLISLFLRRAGLHRAVWTQTELFLTFPPSVDASSSPGLKAITLVPRNAPETGGRFRVWLLRKQEERTKSGESKQEKSWNGWDLVWDRKIEGGFPELKILVRFFLFHLYLLFFRAAHSLFPYVPPPPILVLPLARF